MRAEPICPRCRGPLHTPGAPSGEWECDVHGAVSPLRVRPPGREGLDAVRADARVPVWVPWPPPAGWRVTGFAAAGDGRSGPRAVAVALSGPAPLGGPADLVLVAEDPGIGLGAGLAGLDGPDPGVGFDDRTPNEKLEIQARPVPLWVVEGGAGCAVYAGESLGHWLWALLWPPDAGLLLMEDLALRDLREDPPDLPYGPLCARLGEPPSGEG